MMRIALFGATGGTGRQFIRQACAAGHEVTAVVQDPDRPARFRWLAAAGALLILGALAVAASGIKLGDAHSDALARSARPDDLHRATRRHTRRCAAGDRGRDWPGSDRGTRQLLFRPVQGKTVAR
jgi:uncharacterized protein YbjT (DUF2867 family)